VEYSVGASSPGELTAEELAACVDLIAGGGAVAVTPEKLRQARMFAVARTADAIVGVGSIKRDWPQRAVGIARTSGFDFPKETPELGYIAVAAEHQGKGLSHRLVGTLLKAVHGAAFATTDDERMKRTLLAAGFARQGREWQGHRGLLSLWMKQSERGATEGTSPAASGPAGSLFEGRVGAFFLLSLLVRAEVRGLPGTISDRVQFQRASEGHPLDDVVVHAHDAQGKPALLEIQVKKGITFAPSDEIFRSVVTQIVKASSKPEFMTTRYQLAIAISKTSNKIDGAYQDVLTWARELGDAATFISRINRPGSANDAMRTFVKTFRSHLQAEGAAHDDNSVWQMLRRLQIFVFDFTPSGGNSEELAKERAVRALHHDESSRASELWATLTTLAIQIAAAGGDRTRDGLVQDLQKGSFRLVGDTRTFSARAALAEASRNALADIDDRVNGTMLTRHERVTAVRAALDTGRYVEIRGDAGVGKSGVLKHIAEQVSLESQVIALSPNRTTPRGWLAMRGVLGYDGTAHDLLSDIALNGGAVLFLDSLDFFDEQERLTVIDLVREAAKTPGMSVIATARREFGVSEPSWLPTDVINELGRAETVVIDELSAAEVADLADAAPQLAPLLSDSHPARPVARNLFRLSRLASLPAEAQVARTEVEMAELWWQTADGRKNETHRDRARVLRSLAERAVTSSRPFDAVDLPSSAVDALVDSQTLRDLGQDRVAFRHDVLEEWAIANLLIADPTYVERLPFHRPAPAGLARGVELAARMTIEHAVDSSTWKTFADILSRPGHHSSWRRAALMALVHSEIANDLLTRASDYLLNNTAEALRELIRLVMAVDADSGKNWFTKLGFAPEIIPAGLSVPSGPSWQRLILWLLLLGDSLPIAAIPDVVDLYTGWSMCTFGHDPLTPLLVQWLYRWLVEIEGTRHAFRDQLSGGQMTRLAGDLRLGFLTFCHRAPELAGSYLENVRTRDHNDRIMLGIIKNSGALAQAAPKELAECTLEFLISKDEEEDDDDRLTRNMFHEAFGFHDTEFIPASPAQGPFLQLLIHAPEHGVRLIRQLIDHAISFLTRGRDFGADVITISFLDGTKKRFPWIASYSWSRDVGSGPTIAACALMALEAWGHRRIEAGESVDKVLADIVGDGNPPAAYLLVAADLLLSHWPKSRTAVIPFLACPELLCLDRQRVVHDGIELPDLFGLKALQKEPTGAATLASLKGRPSRRRMLDQLLGYYAIADDVENRNSLAELLREAALRLGQPKELSNFADPAFMAVHALNQIDPKNWRANTVETGEGPTEIVEYVSPEAEAKQLERLEKATRERRTDGAMDLRIRTAFNNIAKSSASFAAQTLEWARRQSIANGKEEAQDEEIEAQARMRDESLVMAAFIVARDGTPELIAQEEGWIRGIFRRALKGPADPVHRVREGLQFNPTAIAFAGTILLLKNHFTVEDVASLLQSAGNENPAAAHGFTAGAGLLSQIDERLPRAVLRSAFAACAKPRREWRKPEADYNARLDIFRQRVRDAIQGELEWLEGKRNEPAWPELPLKAARSRQHLRPRKQSQKPVGEPPELDVYADDQAAALWLSGATGLFDVAKRPWLRDVVERYGAWTFTANGSQLGEDDGVDSVPREWNEAFFRLLAHCLPGLSLAQIEEIALKPITGLPDRAFFDVMRTFLRDLDSVYFNDLALEDAAAAHVRTTLFKRITETGTWKYHVRDHSTSTEIHFGPAIATILFNDYWSFQPPPKCYLNQNGIDRLHPFLPLLKEVAQSAQFLLATIAVLNLLEVSPRAAHLEVIVAAGKGWLAAHPDDKAFWIDQEIGRRLCTLLDAILSCDSQLFGSHQPLRKEIDSLSGSLVRMGVPEAHRLETRLRLI
jgi:GNAT superfamily N-acetyltransferase